MRKIIKRSVVVLLAGVLLFSLSGCKKKQKKDEVQRYAWPLGTSSPEDTVTQLYAEKFAKEVSDHIVFMEQGVIVEEGTPDELFSSENARVREFIGKVSA